MAAKRATGDHVSVCVKEPSSWDDIELNDDDFLLPTLYSDGASAPVSKSITVSRQGSEPFELLRTKPLCQKCLTDRKREAIIWCESCDQLLCADCLTSHAQVGTGHRYKPVEDDITGQGEENRSTQLEDTSGFGTEDNGTERKQLSEFWFRYAAQVGEEVDEFVSDTTTNINQRKILCERSLKQGLDSYAKTLCTQAKEQGESIKRLNLWHVQEYLKLDASRRPSRLAFITQLRARCHQLEFVPPATLTPPDVYRVTMGWLAALQIKVLTVHLEKNQQLTGPTLGLEKNRFVECIKDSLYSRCVKGQEYSNPTKMVGLKGYLKGMCSLYTTEGTHVYCTVFSDGGRSYSLIVYQLIEPSEFEAEVQLHELNRVVLHVKGTVGGVSIQPKSDLLAVASVYEGKVHISVFDSAGVEQEWNSEQLKWSEQPRKKHKSGHLEPLKDSDACDVAWFSDDQDVFVLLKAVYRQPDQIKESRVIRVNAHSPNKSLWSTSVPPSDSIHYINGWLYVLSHSEQIVYALSPHNGMELSKPHQLSGTPRGIAFTNRGDVVIMSYKSAVDIVATFSMPAGLSIK